MYVRLHEELGLGFGKPPGPRSQLPALRKKFISSVVTYKDSDGQCRSTDCAIYVPEVLRNQSKINVVIFFHGLDTCKPKHNFDSVQVMKNFRLDDQVDAAPRKAALAVPVILWKKEDRSSGIIRAAWSAAYVNAFVEEVLQQIGQSSRVRPSLGRLILAGHSAAYDVLTPLAEQFDCGVEETRKGALAKLDRVLALDTTYRLQDAKALEQWARKLESTRPDVQFWLTLSKSGDPPNVWKYWENTRKKTMGKVELPGNLMINNMPEEHCDLPGKYVGPYI